MKFRVVSETVNGFDHITRVFNADTGEEFRNLQAVSFERCCVDDRPVLTLKFVPDAVEITGDCEMKRTDD